MKYVQAQSNSGWRARASLLGLSAPALSIAVWVIGLLLAWKVGWPASESKPLIRHLTTIGGVWIPALGTTAGLAGRPRLILAIVPASLGTVLSGQRTKKPQQIRGLNQNHNHEMKEIFKGAATRASCGVGPLRDFYVALLAKGMKPEMARLTLARKIAAIALTLWKKEERFDAEQLKPQAA